MKKRHTHHRCSYCDQWGHVEKECEYPTKVKKGTLLQNRYDRDDFFGVYLGKVIQEGTELPAQHAVYEIDKYYETDRVTYWEDDSFFFDCWDILDVERELK